MFDLKKYGFEQNSDDVDECISEEGFIIYAGIGVGLSDSYEFR